MTYLSRNFQLSEFQNASQVTLNAEEQQAAAWWAVNVLQPIRDYYGRPVVVSSFVRTTEISGPRQGQVETGPHGRRSAVPGNAVDFVIDGQTSIDVARQVDRMFPGTNVLWAKLAGYGAPHVHLTRKEHPGSVSGLGMEVLKSDGTIGVQSLTGSTSAPGTAASTPASGTPASTAGQLPGISNTPNPPGTPGKFTAKTFLLIAGIVVAGLVVLHFIRRR